MIIVVFFKMKYYKKIFWKKKKSFGKACKRR
jgi:hypothetical protein